MEYFSLWPIGAALLFFLLYAPGPKLKARPQRIGLDPGRLKFRTWLSRVELLWCGTRLIEKAYHKVSMIDDHISVAYTYISDFQDKNVN